MKNNHIIDRLTIAFILPTLITVFIYFFFAFVSWDINLFNNHTITIDMYECYRMIWGVLVVFCSFPAVCMSDKDFQ